MSLTKIGSIGINTGIAFAGVTTIATLNGSDAVLSVGGTVNFVSDVSIGGTVSIAGTLTYEDVTNVDAVGLITARAGVNVGSGITLSKDGDIFATGITTISENLKVGTGVTLSPDGDGFFTGVVTATSYAGDGSALTGISVDSTQIVTGNTSVQTVDTGSDGHVKVNTEGSERLRVASDGQVRINCSAQPSATVSGYQFDAGGYNALRISQGGGTSGTDSSSVTVYGGGSSTTVGASAAVGASLNLINTNSTDNNQNSVTFSNSNSLSIAKIIGKNDSHSSRNGSLIFLTSSAAAPAERLRIASGGDVTVNNGNLVIGTAGKGIDFSAQTATSVSGASATAEVLDHYEEGTWTAFFQNVSAPTYEAQGGRYTRIGRMVFCDFTIGVASGLDTSDGSGVQIAGLPFTGSAGGGDTCLFSVGRYNNILGGKASALQNIRYTGGGGIILQEGNDSQIAYNEINSSGYLQMSFAFMIA